MTAGLRPYSRTRTAILLFSLLAAFPRDGFGRSTAQIEGRILDPDGRPVPYAELIVATTSAIPRHVVADQDGRFSIDGLGAGHYELTAIAPGLVSDAAGVDLADGGT